MTLNSAHNSENVAALVLSGGGARAAYQVGVLSGISGILGDRARFPIITGVSAGAINAAGLAAATGSFADAVSGLESSWLKMSSRSVFRAGPVALSWGILRWALSLLTRGAAGSTRGLLDTEPLRRTLAESMPEHGIERNVAEGRLRAIALSATGYATGQTATFVQGHSDLEPWRRAGRVAINTRINRDHVMASSALPIVFPAVPVEGQYYGDGSIRQLAPLAPAIHLGATRILAISVRHRPHLEPNETPEDARLDPPPAQILGMLLSAIFMDSLDADAERLERVNRILESMPAGVSPTVPLRKVNLMVLRPSQDLGVLAAGMDHCLPTALRWLVRGLGSGRLRSQDFLSYLLFERPYLAKLIDLGRRDALAQADRIAAFLRG